MCGGWIRSLTGWTTARDHSIVPEAEEVAVGYWLWGVNRALDGGWTRLRRLWMSGLPAAAGESCLAVAHRS